jgi:hypothetical protein
MEDLHMSNESMMRWYPDREPDPRPIYGWDTRIDPSVKADVTFRDGSPEDAVAWLETSVGEPPVEPAPLQSVPFPPENVRPPESVWVRDDGEVMTNGPDHEVRTWSERYGLRPVSEEIRREIAALREAYPEYPAPAVDASHSPEMTPDQMRRIQALPDGQLNVDLSQNWTDPVTTSPTSEFRWTGGNDQVRPGGDPRMRDDYYVRAEPMTEGQRTIYDHERTVRDSREELANRTRRVYPAGCFQDPPTTESVERPDFPRGEMTGIEEVIMIFRMNNGWEETYVIENPADLELRTVVEQEWIEVGELQRRVIPGIRELRQILISIGSPRNWRRLRSRRWQ